MRVAVIGTGYVGLIAAVGFADSGNDVIAVEKDEGKLNRLRLAESPIYEPGIEGLLRRNTAEGRLTFTHDLNAAVEASRVFFIAVGTPQDAHGAADISAVLDVAAAIGAALRGTRPPEKPIIVVKSTVPVGTSERVRRAVLGGTDACPGEETDEPMPDFAIASNPEFLKQGAAIGDFTRPDRVVIGATDPEAIRVLTDLHTPFCRTGAPILVMDPSSAELAKYAANAMLACRISFMNEIANICDVTGANVDEVRRVVGTDARIGHSFLFPGIGYGGSCFPKDVQALVKTAELHGTKATLLAAIDAVNTRQKHEWPSRIQRFYDPDGLRGKRLAVWGLAFKPQTDDMREAPSIPFVEQLLWQGVHVQAYDPEAMRTALEVFKPYLGPVSLHPRVEGGVTYPAKQGGGTVTIAATPYDALDRVEGLALLTEWNEFRSPDFRRMRGLMTRCVIFDGRNVFTKAEMEREGFEYLSVGRP